MLDLFHRVRMGVKHRKNTLRIFKKMEGGGAVGVVDKQNKGKNQKIK